MRAYYVPWHMQQRLARVLFKATTPPPAKLPGPSPSPKPGIRRRAALAKATAKVIADGGPMHSFPTLLADLTTIAANAADPEAGPGPSTQH